MCWRRELKKQFAVYHNYLNRHIDMYRCIEYTNERERNLLRLQKDSWKYFTTVVFFGQQRKCVNLYHNNRFDKSE